MAALVLFLVALGVRLVTAAAFPDPAYPDALYYANVAREIAAGHGIVTDALWSFIEVGGRLPAAGALPVPAAPHWMPLAALVQVPFLVLLGPGPLASGLPFWIAGAAAAPVARAIALDAGLDTRRAFAAGLLVAAPGALTPFLAQPDNVALTMGIGALALWACGRGVAGSGRAFVAGGALVGLAWLARTDGLLLALPFALAALRGRLRPGARIPVRTLAACALACLLVASPWLIRQVVTFGTPLPSVGGGRLLWIGAYDEQFSVSAETTLATFLAQGAGPIAGSRLAGVAWAAALVAMLPLLGILAPFAAAGTWRLRHHPVIAPAIGYGIAMILVAGIVFTVHVPRGNLLHQVAALVPHLMVAVVAGVTVIVEAVARRRPSWDASRAGRTILAMTVTVALLASGAATAASVAAWRREAAARAPILAALASVPAGDRVMSPDPGAYRYHGGRPGILTPYDPLPVIEEAARRYGIRWLAIERGHVVPALVPVWEGTLRPAWLSAPLVRTGDAALYAVCLAPDDERCAA